MTETNPLIFVRTYVNNNTDNYRIETATFDKEEAFKESNPGELWFTEVHIFQGDNLRSIYAWHPYEGVWKPDIGQPDIVELEPSEKTQNLHAL